MVKHVPYTVYRRVPHPVVQSVPVFRPVYRTVLREVPLPYLVVRHVPLVAHVPVFRPQPVFKRLPVVVPVHKVQHHHVIEKIPVRVPSYGSGSGSGGGGYKGSGGGGYGRSDSDGDEYTDEYHDEYQRRADHHVPEKYPVPPAAVAVPPAADVPVRGSGGDGYTDQRRADQHEETPALPPHRIGNGAKQ